MRLDADEDQTASLNELPGESAAPANLYARKVAPAAAPAAAPPPAPGPLVLAEPGSRPRDLAERLQQRWGSTRQALGLDARTFDRLDADADGDGKLDVTAGPFGSARWTATATATCRAWSSWARTTEFRRLDLDGDGLISSDEVMKADAALCRP